jgi:HD-like signal output (HDOD) protein
MDVINLVRNDANLTARVLKIVNSAAFGLINNITSIDRAISYLGERVVISIAIGDCAGKLFEKELLRQVTEKDFKMAKTIESIVSEN